jgi:hypothetical protein
MAKPATSDFKDAIETMLEADSTLRGGGTPLISSDNNIQQFHNQGKMFDATTQTLISSPALLICWDGDKWINDGEIHDREMHFTILALVSEATYADRAADSDPIVDAVYACLVDQEPSGLTGSNGRIEPISTQHIAEVQDAEGNPIEMSAYEMKFKCAIEWQ